MSIHPDFCCYKKNSIDFSNPADAVELQDLENIMQKIVYFFFVRIRMKRVKSCTREAPVKKKKGVRGFGGEGKCLLRMGNHSA
jgi:hypothetical protein